MSLFAITNGQLWEAPRATPAPPDPSRPTAPLRAVPGREQDAARANEALRVLFELTRDESLVRDARVALICADVVEVDRSGR